MKTLILLRHAKAVPNDDFIAEHDRPLAPKGEEDAALMGAYLREQKLIPDQVLCSSALRAQRTWQLASAKLGKNVPSERLREVYNAGSGSLFETLRRCANASNKVLVVGHNPGLQSLAVALAGSGDSDALAGLREKFPTAALAVVDLDLDEWAALAPSRGALRAFVRPKDLRG
jgi:phosphohistidine phosphatase